jgi:hypothetical protein
LRLDFLSLEIKEGGTTMTEFYRIPRALMSKEYKGLNPGAKILYGLLLNEYTTKNYKDNENNLFVILPREKAKEKLNIADQTIGRYFKYLNEYNLIKEKRQGLTKPNRIYILKFFDNKD